MKRTLRVFVLLALLVSFVLPTVVGCASTSKDQPRPMETVDDFMMLSKPENPNAKY